MFSLSAILFAYYVFTHEPGDSSCIFPFTCIFHYVAHHILLPLFINQSKLLIHWSLFCAECSLYCIYILPRSKDTEYFLFIHLFQKNKSLNAIMHRKPIGIWEGRWNPILLLVIQKMKIQRLFLFLYALILMKSYGYLGNPLSYWASR